NTGNTKKAYCGGHIYPALSESAGPEQSADSCQYALQTQQEGNGGFAIGLLAAYRYFGLVLDGDGELHGQVADDVGLDGGLGTGDAGLFASLDRQFLDEQRILGDIPVEFGGSADHAFIEIPFFAARCTHTGTDGVHQFHVLAVLKQRLTIADGEVGLAVITTE